MQQPPVREQPPAAAPAQSPIDEANSRAEAAKSALAQAKQQLRGFGLKEMKHDVAGFLRAQEALKQAQQASDEAEAAYRRVVPVDANRAFVGVR